MAEEFIRPDQAPSEDEELLALEDALEDNRHLPAVVEPSDAPPPIGRSWVFDFTTNRFVVAARGREPVRTFGTQTVMTWCEKTLRTAQGAHAIYPSDYGVREPNRWFGRRLTGADYAQMQEDIHEALTYHPRISDVVDFEFYQDADEESLEFACTVVLDDETTLTLDGATIGEAEA